MFTNACDYADWVSSVMGARGAGCSAHGAGPDSFPPNRLDRSRISN